MKYQRQIDDDSMTLKGIPHDRYGALFALRSCPDHAGVKVRGAKSPEHREHDHACDRDQAFSYAESEQRPVRKRGTYKATQRARYSVCQSPQRKTVEEAHYQTRIQCRPKMIAHCGSLTGMSTIDMRDCDVQSAIAVFDVKL
jgi:hypothetical protein